MRVMRHLRRSVPPLVLSLSKGERASLVVRQAHHERAWRQPVATPGAVTSESKPAESLARLTRMTAAFVASDLLRGLLGFATSVIIARGLGRDEFGRWT